MTRAGTDRSRGIYLHSVPAMGTIVTLQIVEDAGGGSAGRLEFIDRALAWFARVEACCSRFDPESEVSRLAGSPGVAIPVSPLLLEALRFALAVAAASNGAFDPTVGRDMAARGFNRHYRTGEPAPAGPAAGDAISYRDVELDPAAQTVVLHRPLTLDLGAVAKGLAVDLAARELQPLRHFALDAGGDLYFAGQNVDGESWAAGIRHPRDTSRLMGVLRVSDAAVCSSGDYERRGDDGAGHILDARTRATAARSASATVVAPTAIVADALATAAFVLGPDEGVPWLERQGAEGLIVSPDLDWRATPDLAARITWT